MQQTNYVDPQRMTPLQKHCAFFDRNGDGVITLWETFTSLRLLGYNWILSMMGTVVTHLAYSYPTSDSWIPDPFMPIYIKNVNRVLHGSDMKLYAMDGSISPEIAQNVTIMLGRFDSNQKGGLSLGDLWTMTCANMRVWDLFGWFMDKIYWTYLWLLTQRNGVIGWDDVAASLDDSLFQKIASSRQSNNTSRQYQAQ